MQLTILGNSGPYPAPGGACSGYLLSQGDTHVLLDCGLGVLARLQEHISLGALSALVLTHLHFDHVSDAFDLAVAMEASGNACPPVFAPETPAPQRALLPAGARFAREFAVGPFSFCLYPARHPVEAYSLVIRVRNGKICLYRRHQLARWIDRNVPDADLCWRIARSSMRSGARRSASVRAAVRSACAEGGREGAAAHAFSAGQGCAGAGDGGAGEFPSARGQTGRKL